MNNQNGADGGENNNSTKKSENGLKEQARTQPLLFIFIIYLFALSCMFCPVDFFGKTKGLIFLGSALVRLAFSGLGIFFMARIGLKNTFSLSLQKLKFWDILLFAALICINNAPFAAYISGSATVKASVGMIALFGLQCLAVGLFEEVFFRGLILPMIARMFAPTKKGMLCAVAISSTLFGLTHLINLFGGADIGSVLVQVVYTTGIGALMAMVHLNLRCMFLPAALHAVYNFGGTMVDSLGSGNIWTAPQIALTVFVAAVAVGYLIFRFFTNKNTPVYTFFDKAG